MSGMRLGLLIGFVAGAAVVGAVWVVSPRHPDPGRDGEAPVPWVIYAGQRGDEGVFRVSWTTPRARRSMVVHAPDRETLQRVLEDDGAAGRVHAMDAAWFEERGARLWVYRGLPPGRPEGVGEEAYRATHHRQEFRLAPGAVLHYAVWDGDGLRGPWAFGLPAGERFRAVHVGHSFSLLDRKRDRRVPFPAGALAAIRDATPDLALHSGDLWVSAFDWEAMRRDTLEALGSVTPGLPLLISGANHDLGWPQKNGSLAPDLFRHLLDYPYVPGTTDYFVDYRGVRFVMIDYLEFRRKEAGDALEERLLRWCGEAEGPVVVVWGGSNRSFWDRMAGIARRRRNLRLILGGDGGRPEMRPLDHGAWLVHNRIFNVIALEFSPETITLRPLHADEALRTLDVATRAPD